MWLFLCFPHFSLVHSDRSCDFPSAIPYISQQKLSHHGERQEQIYRGRPYKPRIFIFPHHRSYSVISCEHRFTHVYGIQVKVLFQVGGRKGGRQRDDFILRRLLDRETDSVNI